MGNCSCTVTEEEWIWSMIAASVIIIILFVLCWLQWKNRTVNLSCILLFFVMILIYFFFIVPVSFSKISK